MCVVRVCRSIFCCGFFSLRPLHLAGVLCVSVCGALFILVVIYSVIFGLVLWP